MSHVHSVPVMADSPGSVSGALAAILTSEAAGKPMRRHDRAKLIAGKGVDGDRYLLGTGHWSDPRWPDQELTLIEQELLEELALSPEQVRRNLVTCGIELAALIGRQFCIGGVRVLGVRPCDPCKYIEGFSRPGVLRQLQGRGGLRARVVMGGTVAVGDVIRPA